MTQQISQTDIDSALAAARAAIRENWGWFLGLGIVFVLAGFGAIVFPLLTTIAAKVALGNCLINDDCSRILVIAIVEWSTLNNWNVHGVKVIRTNAAEV